MEKITTKRFVKLRKADFENFPGLNDSGFVPGDRVEVEETTTQKGKTIRTEKNEKTGKRFELFIPTSRLIK